MLANRLHLRPGGHCQGEVTLPGDKSLSHRAVMLSSLAEGDSTIRGFLPGEDCQSTVDAMRALGVEITEFASDHLHVKGVGLHGLTAPSQNIDCGNAGTLMRLLAGILAGQKFATTLVGDDSLQKRPMLRVVNPLRQMGGLIDAEADGTPPIKIRPNNHFKGIRYALPVASAQVKSCVLLAGLFAKGETKVIESWPTRDHTERLLQFLSYPIETKQISEQPFQRQITLQGGGKLIANDIQIPADISHAAFLLVAACITPGSKLIIKDVGVNPTRIGILHCLLEMGAKINKIDEKCCGGEPVATLEVETSELRGITVPESWVPLTIDEFPAFAVAATFAEGETVVRGAEELRHKESDRIAAMVDGINALGGEARALADGMVIQGKPLTGGSVDALGDHRIAMAFAAAGAAASRAIYIDNAKAISTSWPTFVETFKAIGFNLD